MTTSKRKFKPGDKVRLVGQRRIAYVYKVSDLSFVRLDRDLGGFTWWHRDDLVLVTPRKK